MILLGRDPSQLETLRIAEDVFLIASRDDSPYIGPVMLNRDQQHYLEEVLGLNSAGLMLAADLEATPTPAAPMPAEHHALLVLTYPLDDNERALLKKILASIKLETFTHVEQAEISLAEFPAGLTATKVLAFIEYPPGKNNFEDATWLVLPPIAQMTGANAAVVARKKEAWNLLQQFARENA